MPARRVACVFVVVLVSLSAAPRPRLAGRPPLSSADIDAITELVTLEDARRFDEDALGRLLKSAHPEVRRRAALAVGRIVNPRGRALLESARGDADAEVAATVVFATGQLKDAGAVVWLAGLLSDVRTPAAIAREAACALGKIRSPEARTALLQYLAAAAATQAAAPVVAEALFSIGRFTGPADLAPIVRWASAKDDTVRWHAAWALFRPRDPAAIPELLRLSSDPSPDVRFWSVRGLAPAPPPANRGAAAGAAAPATVAPAPAIDRDRITARLRDAARDPDRRVRTEAIRALGQFDDDASFMVVLAALDSPDTWLSVSAAEVMGRFPSRADVVVPKLVAAEAQSKPLALRITALAPLVALAPAAAVDAATLLIHESSQVARSAAAQALGRLGAPGRAALDKLAADPATARLLPPPAGSRPPRPPDPVRSAADYRRIVERWIVPDYNGAPKPRAVWQTPRGTIEIELYPGDAPLGVEHFVRVVDSGSIVGTEFGRVVPNFVAQQNAIRDANTLRDEVNRHGLTRGNLSWASAGLDTGRPGYTLGSTPQPHNEGDFTALGRVVTGMDVVDRLELGDAITGATMRIHR